MGAPKGNGQNRHRSYGPIRETTRLYPSREAISARGRIQHRGCGSPTRAFSCGIRGGSIRPRRKEPPLFHSPKQLSRLTLIARHPSLSQSNRHAAAPVVRRIRLLVASQSHTSPLPPLQAWTRGPKQDLYHRDEIAHAGSLALVEGASFGSHRKRRVLAGTPSSLAAQRFGRHPRNSPPQPRRPERSLPPKYESIRPFCSPQLSCFTGMVADVGRVASVARATSPTLEKSHAGVPSFPTLDMPPRNAARLDAYLPMLAFSASQGWQGAAQSNPSPFWTIFGNPLEALTVLQLGQRLSNVRTIIRSGGKNLSSHCGPPSFCSRSIASTCTPDSGISVQLLGHEASKAFNSGVAAYSGLPPNTYPASNNAFLVSGSH